MSQKKARTFDLQAMLGETLKTAQESSRETLAKREQDEKDRREKSKKRPVSETESVTKPVEAKPTLESDEDVGPALPPGFVIPNMQQTKNKEKNEHQKENDSESDEESDDEVIILQEKGAILRRN